MKSIVLGCAASLPQHGQPLGAISISGPSIRITRDRLQELGKLVSSVADELTGGLGGKRDALDPDLSTAISPKISTLRKVRTSKKRHLMQQSFR